MMPLSWKSLALRLPLLILLSGVVPLLVFGVTSLDLQRDGVYRSQLRATERTASMAAEHAAQRLSLLRRGLNNDAVNLDLLGSTPQDLDRALAAMLSQYEDLSSLALLDSSGREQAKVSQQGGARRDELVARGREDLVRQALNGNEQIGSALRCGDDYIVELFLPLLDPLTRTPSALLVAGVSLDDLFGTIEKLSIGKEGTVYVIDPRGRIVAHQDHRMVLTEARLVVDEGAKGQAAKASTGVRNAAGIPVQLAISAVAGTGLRIVAERPIAELEYEAREAARLMYIILGLLLLASLSGVLLVGRWIVAPLRQLVTSAGDVAGQRFDAASAGAARVEGGGEIGEVARAFAEMTAQLAVDAKRRQREQWHARGLTGLDDCLRGLDDLVDIADEALKYLARYVDARGAALYLKGEGRHCRFLGGYASQGEVSAPIGLIEGQGLLGQVARERQLLLVNDAPAGYMKVSSALGDADAASLALVPLLRDAELIGVMEFGAFTPFSDSAVALLEGAGRFVAIALATARGREDLREALAASQRSSQQLQLQQEELQAANEELEARAKSLVQSEEELQAANEELEEQSERLRTSDEELQVANEELEETATFLREEKQLAIEKNRLLEEANSYKSQFLANTSHELRTPLNSLLLLAQTLASNRDGNLSNEQVDAVEVIYSSGCDLLNLINDILDLSKIEAGRMELRPATVDLLSLRQRLLRNFAHMAKEKQLEFEVQVSDALPAQIDTDLQRLEQILRNLVSNALKFTRKGSVQVLFETAPREGAGGGVAPAGGRLAVRVVDTGIGIPPDKLETIFGAFQQVDGSLAREFAGTGLGLTIARQLTGLLGGELKVASEEGHGTTFTLLLPMQLSVAAPLRDQASTSAAPKEMTPEKTEPVASTPGRRQGTAEEQAPPGLADDRAELADGKRAVLIVEDDLKFARLLANECRRKGFAFLHAADGRSGLRLAEEYTPAAILLDIQLPLMNGIDLLKALKESIRLRHIPVHVLSVEDHSHEVLSRGAVSFINKPVDQNSLLQVFEMLDKSVATSVKRMLVVDNEQLQRRSIIKLIGNSDVQAIEADCAAEAYECLRNGGVDCMILDLTLPDMSGFELLDKLEQEGITTPPVIIYTSRELSRDEEATLQRYASSIIIKGVRSPERLLDEVSLFLHRVVAKLPPQKRRIIDNLHGGEANFKNRKVLLVDDDMRNIFALATVLEERGLEVVKAVNGKKALEALDGSPDIDLVLMDIMMPEMDGLEAIRRIRADERFHALPILALTAKAMKSDQQSCLEAGANDYLAKPVDLDKLLSLLRIWLYR
jgi:CheY-like chemotaxis protein